ncbi:type 4a pilus biogenesis protein PilO [Moraxella sp. ZY210820]|uniref:type 4a pilus biogenesis protein PilO n=1 Tax=unclassified Moraxella TaxID=2685852 RepID=UPI00272F94DF|nr:type 4a pilus biogenesis protein PilO [Moraxella sp. ZY210820]WLF84125.1 type 4a pilus biogenesis protein PilO [Moraxella sp. ZY210820]
MSREDLDGVNVTPKKKMTVDQFFKQFNNLDNSNVGGWPLPVKITVWIFIFAAVCAAGYFFVIKPKQEEISTAEAQQENLLKEFQEKDSRVRNSKLLQEQLKQMEAQFQQQLTQLPKETEIPALVEDINITGVNAGLKFKNIKLEPEVTQEFFIEQPITIEATGDYHNFGNFVSNIALLPRIVTLHDFEIIGNVDSKSDIPVVTYKITAKTYRYKEQTAEVTTPEAGKEGGAN